MKASATEPAEEARNAATTSDPTLDQDPLLHEMITVLKSQAYVLNGLSLQTAKYGEAKCRQFKRQAHRMEGAQHVIEACAHWFTPELCARELFRVFRVLTDNRPGYTPELANALRASETPS